jgi:hypothetical protein
MMTGAIIGTIAIVLLVVLVGLWIDRRAPILPKPEELAPQDGARKKAVSHAAGEAPATALRIPASQVAKLRANQRCPECRAVMESAPDEHVRYNDADLLICHFTCTKCSGKRTLYANLRP